MSKTIIDIPVPLGSIWTVDSVKRINTSITKEQCMTFNTVQNFWCLYHNSKLSEDFHKFSNDPDAILTNFRIDIFRKNYNSQLDNEIELIFSGVNCKHVLNILLFLIGENHSHASNIAGVRFLLAKEAAHIVLNSIEAKIEAMQIISDYFVSEGIKNIEPRVFFPGLTPEDCVHNSDHAPALTINPPNKIAWTLGFMVSIQADTWEHRKLATVTSSQEFWNGINAFINSNTRATKPVTVQTFSMRKNFPEIYLFRPYGEIETHPHWDIVKEASGTEYLKECTVKKITDAHFKGIVENIMENKIDNGSQIAGIRIRPNQIRIWITSGTPTLQMENSIFNSISNLLGSERKIAFISKTL